LLPTTAINIGGQSAWSHDEGFSYGYLHTYDQLQPGKDAPRKVHVLLPWGYESSRARYPVVYMNDGDVVFWPGGSAYKSWRVAETLSALQHKSREVIVVAVCPHERNREYTHTRWSLQYDFGGVDEYSDHLAYALKPFIDAQYRTIAAREETSIVGSSHGGLAAFYTACRRPESFGKAGVLSPSFWVGVDFGLVKSDQALSGSSLLQATGATLGDAARRPRLWIDWGLVRGGGFHNSVIEDLSTKRSQEMIALLTRDYEYTIGQDLLVHIDPVGGHDEDAWAYRFGLLMQAFYPQ
jgi:pimeloyl-ACP methyl ester carboxylesterase